jgi:hypothetical protein
MHRCARYRLNQSAAIDAITDIRKLSWRDLTAPDAFCHSGRIRVPSSMVVA